MSDFNIQFARAFDGVSCLSHGFYGRKGGVSTGLYQGLNAGRGSRDKSEHVKENRRRIAASLGVDLANLLTNHQCHTTEVVHVEGPLTGTPPRADAMVSKTPGVALSALTADCAPVLFVDPEARIIGAAHAGWRGALAGVTDATIGAMVELGAHKSRIRAAIGPCISQENYEVGPDFVAAFISASLANGRFFRTGKAEKSHFDLKAYLKARLRTQRIGSVSVCDACTYGEPDEYYSYRYNTHHGQSDYGRNISAIVLNQ